MNPAGLAEVVDLGRSAALRYYSVSDVAALLGVSRVSVWRWIKSGRLPAARMGHRTVRIKHEDVGRVAEIGRTRLARRTVAPAIGWNVVRPSEHVVAFYEADAFLIDGIAEFIAPALEAGSRAVLVCTPQHCDGVLARLTAASIDVAQAEATGRLVVRDARATLTRFMVDGWPNADRFAGVVDELIAGVSGDQQIRIFGEMVALLVADGLHQAALTLESLWSQAQNNRPFSLLCAYPMKQFGERRMQPVVTQACQEHSVVIPSESYSLLTSDTERLREIALLQQKAASLEFEVVERQQLAERLERALESERAARDAAEHALRARDEFLSTASHELRTPMAVLGVQAQVLLRRWQRTGSIEPERLEKALRTIGGQADKLGRLVNQLLDVSRLDSGKLTLEPHPTDLAELVREAASATNSVMDEREIRVSAPQVLEVCLDPLRIEQVLINLLDNAMKYTPPATPIEVELKAAIGWARLSVRDRGPGIPPDKRGHIFERFFQAHDKGSRTGLGLGLYLSRTIVELHGGGIAAEFPSDGGTRFVVDLPM